MNDNLVSAVFDGQTEAERAVTELRGAKFPDSMLSVIAQHDGKTTTTGGDGNVEDNGGGLLRGLVGGGALGAGLGVAALAIPGVGPLAAAGVIAASVVPEAIGIGALVGAAAGGLNETLMKHGVSRDDVTYYNDRISSGGVFVSVDTGGDATNAATVREIFMRCGGHSSTQTRMAMS